MVNLAGATSLKKIDAPSPRAITGQQLLCEGRGLQSHPSPVHAGTLTGLTLWWSCSVNHSCYEFMSRVIMSQRCCVFEFPPLKPLTLTNFPPFLLHQSLSFRGWAVGDGDRLIGGRAPQSYLFSALWPIVSFCIPRTTKLLWWGLGGAFSQKRNADLESSLILCRLSKEIIGSPRGLWAPQPLVGS